MDKIIDSNTLWGWIDDKAQRSEIRLEEMTGEKCMGAALYEHGYKRCLDDLIMSMDDLEFPVSQLLENLGYKTEEDEIEAD